MGMGFKIPSSLEKKTAGGRVQKSMQEIPIYKVDPGPTSYEWSYGAPLNGQISGGVGHLTNNINPV